ncbi:MAG TPA: GAF domain-containing sensor histidine kinase, partial [Dehalococcoidia bacterium]
EESLRQTRALQRLTSAVAGSLDLQETLEHALNAAAQLFGADRAAIYMQSAATQQMNPVAAHGLSAEYLNAVRERYEGPTAVAPPELPSDYRYIADATTDPRMGPLREAAQHEGFRSMLFVSLQYRGQPRGVFVLYHDEVRTYSETEIGLAKTFGEQAAIAIEHARLFEESRRLAVVDERNRLARELHDSVTQSLFSISLITRALPNLMDREPERARERVERLAELSSGALAEMRSLIFELRPAALEQEGLVAAITKFAAAFESREGIKIAVRVARERRLPLDQEEALFRIAQEALNNVAKHAQATNVSISLDYDDGCTTLTVRDNGVGFDPAKQPAGRRGFGMTSMRERATLAGATLEVRSAPGAGTEVCVTLPCGGKPQADGGG